MPLYKTWKPGHLLKVFQIYIVSELLNLLYKIFEFVYDII